MKIKLSKLLFISLGGGVLGSFLFFYIGLNEYISELPTLNQKEESTSFPPSVSPQTQGMWEKIADESSLSTVGIQVFQENRLVRQGGALIVSSDGLVLTASDMFVTGGVYQIFYEDKISKGTVV